MAQCLVVVVIVDVKVDIDYVVVVVVILDPGMVVQDIWGSVKEVVWLFNCIQSGD